MYNGYMNPAFGRGFLLPFWGGNEGGKTFKAQKKGLKKNLQSLLSVVVTPTGFEPVLPA